MWRTVVRMTTSMSLALIGIGVAYVTLAMAQKQNDLPVTSTIVDGTLKIQSDDLGPYKNTKAVQSVVQPIGDWVLDTNYSSLSSRSVYLTFSDPVPGSGPGGGDPIAPFASELVKARIITQCPTYGHSMLSLGEGQPIQCGLVIHFDYGALSYRLTMNPINYATDFVKVTCVSVGTGNQCNHWTIVPADVSGINVAKLLVLTTIKGKKVAADQGNFLMSFAIDVSNP